MKKKKRQEAESKQVVDTYEITIAHRNKPNLDNLSIDSFNYFHFEAEIDKINKSFERNH